MALTVGELSRLTGVTVRALHHYDAIGLVPASERTAAGYRLYGPDDVARLHEVLILRELGLSLDAIAATLSRPATGAERAAILRRHRAALAEKRQQLDALLAAVDATIARAEQERPMTEDDFAAFDAEARERWGATDEYQESARRTRGYGPAEWAEIRRESDSLNERLVARFRSGGDARDLAREHRAHISRWFYPCSVEMHRALAEMYVADPRFAAHYERLAPGLAVFWRDAILAD